MSIFAKNAKQLFMSTSFLEATTNNKNFDSSKSSWYRNKAGQNIIRMLPLREDGQPSFIQTVNHFFLKLKTDDGAIVTVSPVCLDFLFDESGTDEQQAYLHTLLAYAFNANKLTEKDYDSLKSSGGCPICRCFRAYYRIDKMKSMDLKARQRTFILMKDRLSDNPTPDKVFIYSMSLTMWSEFIGQTTDLINEDNIYVNDPDDGRDFKFEYVSSGRDSEYKKMVFSQVKSKFGDIDGEIPNLVKIWLSGVRDYNTLTDVVKQTPITVKIALENGLTF